MNNSVDTKYLLRSRVYSRITNRATGKTYNRLNRVSAAYDAQFPKKYRRLLMEQGNASTVKQIMIDKGMTMQQAWKDLQFMCNNPL